MTVSAELADETAVIVSPAAFAWNYEGYETSTSSDGSGYSGFDQEAAEAIEGARFALEHVAGPQRHALARVVIVAIRSTMVDTAPGNIAYATCRAVWQALGLEGAELPPLVSGHRRTVGPWPEAVDQRAPVKDVWREWFP